MFKYVKWDMIHPWKSSVFASAEQLRSSNFCRLQDGFFPPGRNLLKYTKVAMGWFQSHSVFSSFWWFQVKNYECQDHHSKDGSRSVTWNLNKCTEDRLTIFVTYLSLVVFVNMAPMFGSIFHFHILNSNLWRNYIDETHDGTMGI